MSQGSSLVIYVEGDSFFHKINPVNKLAFAFSMVMMAIATTGILIESVLVFITLVAVVVSRVHFRHFWRVGKFLFILGLSWAVLAPLFYARPGGDILFHTPIKDVTIEGVEFGMNIGMRFLVLGFTSLVFIFTTRPVDLVQDLNELGLPYRYSHAISLGVVFLPIILDEARVIRQAQIVRDVGAGKNRLSKTFQRISHLLFGLVVRSLRRAQQMAISLDTKGFGRYPERTYMHDLNRPLAGRILGISILVIMVLYIGYLAIFGGGIQGITYIRG